MDTTKERALVRELILKNGEIIDPANNFRSKADVLVQDGIIAEIGTGISVNEDARVIDVTNKIITPGLIDIHGHFYDGGNGSSVHADTNCLPYGVTTGVDAGSAGYLNYKAMRDYVFPNHRTNL